MGGRSPILVAPSAVDSQRSARRYAAWLETAGTPWPRISVPQRRISPAMDSEDYFRAEMIALVPTVAHLHHIVGILPRIADVGKLVAQFVSHLVIRQAGMMGHIAVGFDFRMPVSPSCLRFPCMACLRGFESLADRQNVTEPS